MPAQAWLALGFTALAVGLFFWNRFRADVVAVLIATLLIVTGLVTPAEGVSGFANEATIAVALLLVLSTGLAHTGAVDALARTAVRLAGQSEWRLLVLAIVVVIPVSAIINNTAAVAVLMPALLGATRQVDVSPSRILMPLSFASQLGGALTLIGTSTNLLVAGLMLDLGFERIRIFELTAPALVVMAATPFAIGVMFAASNAFMTPIGYQTNLFVYGPGGYRFGDFLRVGAPLSVVTAVTAVIAIPVFIPFEP